MDDELTGAFDDVFRRVLALASRDEGLRGGLRTLARLVLSATVEAGEAGPASAEAKEVPAVDLPALEPVATPASITPPASPEAPAGPLPELTLGRSRPPEPATAPVAAKGGTADAELAQVVARCRLKAEGARWAATRRRRIAEGADFQAEVAPEDREILDRSRALLDCFLWMNSANFAVPADLGLLETVAGCFDAVADATALILEMIGDIEAHRGPFEEALDVLAEAQSALRVAIDRVHGPKDPDQFRAYDWLRGTAYREQIFIRRHMRMEDPADPARLPSVVARIEAIDGQLQDTRRRVKQRKSGLGRLRYHAKLIGAGTGGEHDWRKVIEAVEQMVEDGIPPSSREIRDVLLPILDALPADLGDLPQRFTLALREIDRYLAGRATPADAPAPEPPTPEVVEVARLLAGKSLILIGGVRRPDAHKALKEAFGLDDLVWFETREHESIDVFEPYIARPSIALALLAIRWSSHSFGDVKRFCDLHGKPLVHLPAGYNPNQVAAQILAQCSARLAEA